MQANEEKPKRRGAPTKSLIGYRFGYLLPVEAVRRDGVTFYRCLCSGGTLACKTTNGEEVLVRHSNLRAGKHRSCGCMQRLRESRVGIVMTERCEPATVEDFARFNVTPPASVLARSQRTDEAGFIIDDSEVID